MITNGIIEKLINITIDQAEFFLKDAKEFYPFATVYTNDAEFKPVSINSEENNPKSNIVLEELEKEIIAEFRKGDYLAVALGSDVYLNIENRKVTAIEIKYADAGESINVYIPYYFTENNELILEDSFTQLGTFKLK